MTTKQPNRVLIADELSPRAADLLGECSAIQVETRTGLAPGDLKSIIGEYQGVIVRSKTKLTADILEAAGALRIIGRAGIGVDNIDITAASRGGIVVENAPSGNAVTTAEHALCLLLSLARKIPQATASLKSGKWEKKKFAGSELMGKTLGVIGLGNIGRIVADRARGLKMKVVGYDPFIGRDAAGRLGVELLSLEDLLARADFLTVHTPLTSETRGLLGDEAFARVKPGVLVVNAARGGIVDEDALLSALESGKVAGAALDVFSTEPPPEDSKLVAHPNVVCTPHLGASTEEAQEKVAIEVAEQLIAFFEGGEVRNAINVAPVSGEVRSQLSPWLELSRHLGALVGQLARGALDGGDGFIDDLSVEVIGEAAELGATACTNAALVGLLRNFMDVPVNDVNAPIIASDRGLEVSEVKRSRDRDLASALALTARCGERTYHVKGTLFHIGGRVEPRLVQIDNFLVEVSPRGRILLVLNKDRPGVIGTVGTLLGEKGINVNSLHVGLDKERGVALAMWNVDDEIDPAMLEEVRKLDLIKSAQVVEL